MRVEKLSGSHLASIGVQLDNNERVLGPWPPHGTQDVAPTLEYITSSK